MDPLPHRKRLRARSVRTSCSSWRTIVVFFSDNVGYIGESRLQPGLAVTNNAPLRSGKGALYEGGIRVPLIVRFPGVTRGGAVCRVPVASCDFPPTLLQLAGIDSDRLPAMDGVDFSSLMESLNGSLPRNTLYFHYPHYYPTTAPVRSLRPIYHELLSGIGKPGRKLDGRLDPLDSS